MLEIAGVSKTFNAGTPNELRALRGIELKVQDGSFVVVIGTNGSGKSTLMNVLGCLDTPSGGEYILNGISVAKMMDNALAEVRNKQIGFVFQTFNLLQDHLRWITLYFRSFMREFQKQRVKKEEKKCLHKWVWKTG